MKTISLEHRVVKVSMKELMEHFKPEEILGYCEACPHYGKIWTCPPYHWHTEDQIKPYGLAYIIRSKVYTKAITEASLREDIHRETNDIFNQVRRLVDMRLMEMEKKMEDGFFLFAGRCIFCTVCEREKNLPCPYPENIHYSLESIGFDVASICSNLLKERILWAKDALPEYFTFISAVLSNKEHEQEEILRMLNEPYDHD